MTKSYLSYTSGNQKRPFDLFTQEILKEPTQCETSEGLYPCCRTM